MLKSGFRRREPPDPTHNPSCVVCMGHMAIHLYAHLHPDDPGCTILEYAIAMPLAAVADLGIDRVREHLCQEHREGLAALSFGAFVLELREVLTEVVGDARKGPPPAAEAPS